MPIDNELLLRFCNETVRPVADRLSALLPLINLITDSAQGQGIASILGTDDESLFRPDPWKDTDYINVGAPELITDSDSGGRTPLTNYDIISFLRVVASLKAMVTLNPSLGPLVGKLAINPRL